MNNFSLYSPEIRFSDIDAMGHVNNAVYLSYFEQARIHFFGQFLQKDWNWNEAGILVARNEIQYLKPVVMGDRISVRTGCTHVGTKSFTLDYRVVRAGENTDELCTTGSSVLVCFDSRLGITTPIPEIWRAPLMTLLISTQ
jgi:acyl-CoA thioester hydrolase